MIDLAQLENEILAEITAATDEPALEVVRVAALGKNGTITALLKTLGTLPPDRRKSEGPLINGIKNRIEAALAERKRLLTQDGMRRPGTILPFLSE